MQGTSFDWCLARIIFHFTNHFNRFSLASIFGSVTSKRRDVPIPGDQVAYSLSRHDEITSGEDPGAKDHASGLLAGDVLGLLFAHPRRLGRDGVLGVTR
jgi:hypothetical protein